MEGTEMSKSNKGLRIGNYRIKPLGLIVLALLVVVIAAIIALMATSGTEGSPLAFLHPTPTPSPTPTPAPTATPTPTPTPSPTPEPTPKSATIRSIGEIAIQDNVLAAARQDDGSYDFSAMLSLAADAIGNADYTVADVEGSMSDTEDYSGGSLLRTPSSLITALKDCGVDMLNLCNDHALDSYFDGLKATMSNCRDAGMEYVGAASSLMEKESGKIVTINGINVGFIAYTDSLNGMEKKSDSEAVEYGVNLIRKSTKPKSDVELCRSMGADVVVAYMSWGDMFSTKVTANQQKMAQALAQAGVDVIIGYNPHVIQPASWIEVKDGDTVTHRTLCLGAPGNLLSDAVDKSETGIIFQFTIQEREDFSGYDIVSPCYVPTYVWRTANEDGSYEYRAVAVGQWLEEAPEGMSYAQHSRLKEVWAEVQSAMGADVAEVIAN